MAQPAKHTPGPWILNENDTGMSDDGTIIAGHGEVITSCVYGNTTDNARANAHLIAAAPAMYEALQAIEARLQGVFDSPALMRQGMLTHDKSADVIRFVRAALAQAEGRQP